MKRLIEKIIISIDYNGGGSKFPPWKIVFGKKFGKKEEIDHKEGSFQYQNGQIDETMNRLQIVIQHHIKSIHQRANKSECLLWRRNDLRQKKMSWYNLYDK